MSNFQKGFIVILLWLSVALLLMAAAILIRRVIPKPSGSNARRSGISGMLIFSAFLLGAVWCLRYAVGYFGILCPDLSTISPEKTFTGLNWLEEIFNSMVHALQTFSMDEDYTAYIISGKTMIRSIFDADTVWQEIYGGYAAVLNLVAPIAGGAVIFEILASVFPVIRLAFSHGAIWREKYYFSELNAASLTLAKSIFDTNTSFFKRPVIIFTDVYTDKEEEKGSEILLEARRIGAICVRDDLSHVLKNRWGTRTFFLIDEKEAGNLRTLTALTNPHNHVFLKNAEVYLFVNDDAYVQVEKNLRGKLRQMWGLDHAKDEEIPLTIIPVQSYRNMISNLLVDIPLYEPLIGKKKNSDGTQNLTVTILGTGHIGTEMFLSVYWFGQILNCNLHINVLSQETQEDFWNKIDYINPEIRHTTIANDPILRINRKGDMAPVYCSVNYCQCDVKSSAFVSAMQGGENSLLDTDYYLVSVGSDEDNISVANIIKKYVGQHRISAADAVGRTVIAYVVYDADLARTLNECKRFSAGDNTAEIFMCAVGSLQEVYSGRNVFMSAHTHWADEVYTSYLSVQERKKREDLHAKRVKDEYKYSANLARGMHIKYKLFSMGLITRSILGEEDPANAGIMEKALETFRLAASGRMDPRKAQEAGIDTALLHRIAWLEHRRWNAFTRVKGFRCTTDYDAYATAGVMGSYKEMDLKLHPCLVECDQGGICGGVDMTGVRDCNAVFHCTDSAAFDLLDELSRDLNEKKYNNRDFKQYDYIFSEF